MDAVFKKPPAVIGRFAVVKLWPKLKAAEDENVARLKITARSLGLECVEITSDGRALEAPHQVLSQGDLDFVIHLHFQTPKAYDVFSFVALWNPVQFYHDWGYRRYSRHLLTHDDFLSCSATGADDHAQRMIARDPTRVPPAFTMYHSLSEPIYEPTLGDRRIFYAGINWERLGKNKGRHQDLLRMLDPTGKVRIHGPVIFQGVNVWEGYKSYGGEIPFDGISIIREINRSGIALVLSSDAHKHSELMSNRLFESLVGGALVICDENPFARRHFGSTILYIDSALPTNQVFAAVMAHMQWIDSHPDKALDMARKAQEIFRQKFSLDKSLIEIYTGLADRRRMLQSLYAPVDSNQRVDLLMLMPEYDVEVLERHIASIKTQRHAGCRAVLLADKQDIDLHGPSISRQIEDSGVALDIRAITFHERRPNANTRRRIPFGRIFSELIEQVPPEAQFCIVAPDEKLLSEHIQSLSGALERNRDSEVAHADIIYRHLYEGEFYHELQQELDCLWNACNQPLGFGRFLFRRSAFADHIHSALRHVDARSVALMVATCRARFPSRRASIIADIQSSFNSALQLALPQELEVIRDYIPDLPAAAHMNGVATSAFSPEPTSLSLKKLSISDRQAIVVDLAHSLPLPSPLRKMLFKSYRFWLRRSKRSPAEGD